MALHIREGAKPQAAGPIMALMQLFAVRKKEQESADRVFGAGLPSHTVPDKVHEELHKVADIKVTPYTKYNHTSPLKAENQRAAIAEYHNKTFKTSNVKAENIRIYPGSSSILAAVCESTLDKDKTALVVYPGYPLFNLPVKWVESKIAGGAHIRTSLDLRPDGKPFTEESRWVFDIKSFAETLNANRETSSLFYLNFPSNPTGYMPTPQEYRNLVVTFANDLNIREKKGLPALTILEDIAYATMARDGKQYYSFQNAVDDLRKYPAHQSDEIQKILDRLESSVVTAHSFSKGFAVSGHRAAYITARDPQLLEALDNYFKVNHNSLNYAQLAVTKACIETQEVDKEAIQVYNDRLTQLEQGLNNIATKWVDNKVAAITGDATLIQGIKDRTRLVPARADAGFFACTRFDMLRGMKVNDEIIAKLKGQIHKIPRPDVQQEFAEIFKDGKINNSIDAALWLLETAKVGVIPIANADPKDPAITLRFSVGQCNQVQIAEALTSIDKAMQQVQIPEYAIAQAEKITGIERTKAAKKLVEKPAEVKEAKAEPQIEGKVSGENLIKAFSFLMHGFIQVMNAVVSNDKEKLAELEEKSQQMASDTNPMAMLKNITASMEQILGQQSEVECTKAANENTSPHVHKEQSATKNPLSLLQNMQAAVGEMLQAATQQK